MFESLRSLCATCLHRLADRIAPTSPAPEVEASDVDPDYADLLQELGAEPPLPGESADVLGDLTVQALSDNLHGLRGLGDQLARAEQDKLALAAHVEELEAEAETDVQREEAVVERLERKLKEREGVLSRTRERLDAQRAKTEDWKRKAAERWHQLTALRKQVKELERTLDEVRDATRPGPLPKKSVSGSEEESRAGRRSAP